MVYSWPFRVLYIDRILGYGHVGTMDDLLTNQNSCEVGQLSNVNSKLIKSVHEGDHGTSKTKRCVTGKGKLSQYP